MSDYTYPDATNWSTKDGLASGIAGKRVSAAEFHTEFSAIATAIATKADKASPTFTGTVTAAALTWTGTATGTILGGTF